MFSLTFIVILKILKETRMVYTAVSKNQCNLVWPMHFITLSKAKFFLSAITYYHNLFLLLIDKFLAL